MSRDDVRQALQAMDDEDVRSRLAAGDFSDVGELELADHERMLVQDAAGEYPDVAGFAFDAFDKFNLGGSFEKGLTLDKYNAAAQYAQGAWT